MGRSGSCGLAPWNRAWAKACARRGAPGVQKHPRRDLKQRGWWLWRTVTASTGVRRARLLRRPIPVTRSPKSVDFAVDSKHERVRVARVRVERNEAREISGCWISVSRDERVVRIWESPSSDAPLMVASLEDVVIEWSWLDAPMA